MEDSLKNIFTTSLILLFTATSFASTLNCQGYKDGDFTGKRLENQKRDFPYGYTQLDGIDMHALMPDERTMSLLLINSKNKSENSKTTITNFGQSKDLSFSVQLSTSSGVYKIICK
jgi:hypothetical protein